MFCVFNPEIHQRNIKSRHDVCTRIGYYYLYSSLYSKFIGFFNNRITSAKINPRTALTLKIRFPKVRKKYYLVASTIRTPRLRHGSFAPFSDNSCGQVFFRIRFSSISAPARRNSFDRGQYLATSPATFRRSSWRHSGAWPNTWRRLNKRRTGSNGAGRRSASFSDRGRSCRAVLRASAAAAGEPDRRNAPGGGNRFGRSLRAGADRHGGAYLPGNCGDGSGIPGARLSRQPGQGDDPRKRQRGGGGRTGSDGRLEAHGDDAGPGAGDDGGNAPGGAGSRRHGVRHSAGDDGDNRDRAGGARRSTASCAMVPSTDCRADRRGERKRPTSWANRWRWT